jgi:hypothetical protein
MVDVHKSIIQGNGLNEKDGYVVDACPSFI